MGLVKPDSSKKAGILKHEGAGSGVENKMIMPGRTIARGLGREPSGHAEVDSQPAVGTKAKEHLLPVGVDRAQGLSRQGGTQMGGANATKNPFLIVEVNAQHPFTQGRGPAAAEIEDFGKFRHLRRVGSGWGNSKLG